MKKILAILLAVCLTLSLSVVAFAADKSPDTSVGSVVDPSDMEAQKTTYFATDAEGRPINSHIDFITAGPEYNEVVGYQVVGVYAITLYSSRDDDTLITFDVFAPDASENDIVLVRDEWDVLEGANLKVNGNRATFTVPAGTVKQWKYFAIVKDFNTVEVEDPKQDTGNVTDDPADGDEMNAGDQTEDPKEEDNTPAPSESDNPPTGVVLAVVPMIVAAAAIVISKKR